MGCTHSAPSAAEPSPSGGGGGGAAAATAGGTLPPATRKPAASAVVTLLGRARRTAEAVGSGVVAVLGAGGGGAAGGKQQGGKDAPPPPNNSAAAAQAAAQAASAQAAAQAAAAASPSADVLGRGAKDDVRALFTFGKVLGKGQFGVTRVVTDPLTGEQSACKVIPKRKLVGLEDAEDVRREVRVLHHLSGHPHVVAFRGAYEDSQAVYIVMELCRGGELFDAVAKRGHFREREAARCVATLLSVVAHCHGMCVALRDLKPENVLFLQEPGGGGGGGGGGEGVGGGGGSGAGAGEAGGCDAAPLGVGWPRHLKVIDFGLSTFVSATDPAPLSELVGSPFYMAPEVLRRSYGRAADVWSVGVIAYILLCGSPPFYGASTAAIFRAVAHDGLDLASPPWPGVSEAAKDFVRRLLTRDPARRPTAAQALRHEWIVAATAPGGKGAGGAAGGNGHGAGSSPPSSGAAANGAAAADLYYQQQQPEILARLRRFAGMGRLRREALRVVAAALPPEEVEGLRAVFRDLDRDGSGAISLEELRQGLRARGATVADDELKRLVASVDLDGSQQLDWGEFLTATVFFGKLERHDRLLAAFQHFDSDGSGHVTEAELREGLARAAGAGGGAGAGAGGGAGAGAGGGTGAGNGGLGGALPSAGAAVAVPDAELNEMLAAIDRDGDGKISYEEFCAMLLGQGGGPGGAGAGKGGGGGKWAAGDGEGRSHRHHHHHHHHHRRQQQEASSDDDEQEEAKGPGSKTNQPQPQQQEQQQPQQQPQQQQQQQQQHRRQGAGAGGLSMVTAARGAVRLDDEVMAAAVGEQEEEGGAEEKR